MEKRNKGTPSYEIWFDPFFGVPSNEFSSVNMCLFRFNPTLHPGTSRRPTRIRRGVRLFRSGLLSDGHVYSALSIFIPKSRYVTRFHTTPFVYDSVVQMKIDPRLPSRIDVGLEGRVVRS